MSTSVPAGDVAWRIFVGENLDLESAIYSLPAFEENLVHTREACALFTCFLTQTC